MTTAAAAPKRQLYTVSPDGDLKLHFHAGQARTWQSEKRFIAMMAGTQGGKALALDTPIPTPGGFREMGQLQVGDLVYTERGQPTRVQYASPVYLGNRCYRLRFDDGTTVVADAEHLWVTETSAQRKNGARRRPSNPDWTDRRPQCQATPDSGIVTTEQIASSLTDRRGASNHAIPLTRWVAGRPQDLPVPPYTLGLWLGDGHSSGAIVTTADPEVLEHVRAEGVTVGPPKDCNAGQARCYRLGGGPRGGDPSTRTGTLQARLRALGVLGCKHIPERYLTAPVLLRLAVLQGLMDSDGHIAEDGRCELVTISSRLAGDVLALLGGLGIKARCARESRGYRISFTTTLKVARLSRKAERLPEQTRPDTRRRFVVGCEPVESVPVRCITVEAATGQYLCTRSYLPTHNTSFGPWWLYREISRMGEGDYLGVTSTFPLMNMKMQPELRRILEGTLRVAEWKASVRSFVFTDEGARRTFGHDPTMETRVICGSADNPDSLEAATAKAAWCDEIGQDGFKLSSFEAILRRLSLNQGRVLGTTTLYNLGWLKQQWYDRWRQGHPDYDVVQFDSIDNPSFPRQEYEAARERMPQWKFNLFYRGRYDNPPGLIYGDYRDIYREEGGHLVHPFELPAEWPRYVGVDFGAVNLATLWLAEDPDAKVFYLYRETLEGGRSTKEHVQQAKERAQGTNVRIWRGGSKSEVQQRLDWQEAGLSLGEPEVADVEAQIDRVIELFRTWRLYCFDTLTGLRDELGTYSRVLDPETNQPTDRIKDDQKFHRLAALRYICQALSVADAADRAGEPAPTVVRRVSILGERPQQGMFGLGLGRPAGLFGPRESR